MQDIALSVGATYFSEKTGDDLSLIEFSRFGSRFQGDSWEGLDGHPQG